MAAEPPTPTSPSTPEALRSAFRHFLREDRVLLTGHSHQAWPDAARDAQVAVFDDAARLCDDKWGAIFDKQAEVGRRILARMELGDDDAIAFGESTHQLVFRLLSCLRWSDRPRVVTTAGEFHSLYRQLRRLEEEGVEVTYVPAWPREGLAERMIAAIDSKTSLVAASAVLFEDACILSDLGAVMERAVEVGAIPLVDAYHAFNVASIDWGPARHRLYVAGGGYKYAGFGNGLCWLRLAADCELRPVYTGWFADFESLADPRDGAPVRYATDGMRFAGATFDASALYRAEAALDVWDRHGLDLPALVSRYRRQTARIIEQVAAESTAFEIVSPRRESQRGGFVSLRHPAAGAICERLRHEGVWVDSRGDLLRLGPAPYITDDEIDRGVATTLRVARELS